MKRCPRCGQPKQLSQFGVDRKRRDGLKCWCKSCRKIECADDFQKHKSRRLEKHATWQLNNREKSNQYAYDWIKRNPEKRKAIDDANNAKRDPAAHRARVLADYHRDREKHLARSRAWRAANKGTVAALLKNYRDRKPELIRALDRNYKARKKGASGSHTAHDIQAILIKQNYVCIYCPSDLRLNGYHVDHIIPLSRGGSNGPENLQALCGLCNLRKKDRTHEEFVSCLSMSSGRC